ncbi:MAG: hypothetical protein ACO1OB_19565 [Archangium sp.]
MSSDDCGPRELTALLVLLTSCATSTAPTKTENAPLTGVEVACMEAVRSNAQLLATDELTQCENDVDCREVAALVSGRCGTFVNEREFVSRQRTVRENLHACDTIPQVVFPCPKLRAACRQHRCEGEPIAEIADDCAEQTAKLKASSSASLRCTEDSQCQAFLNGAATSQWLEENAPQRSALSLACGTTVEPLFAVDARKRRASDEPFPACNDGRCVILKGDETYTTKVRADSLPLDKVTEIDPCFINVLIRARMPKMVVRATVAHDGSVNQFEFLHPSNLTPAAMRSYAYQLHQCRVPFTRGGQPVSFRWTLTMLYER